MRAAPAVVVELRCPPAWRAVQALLVAAAATACSAACLQHAAAPAFESGGVLALVASAAAAAGWRGASRQAGRLRWDGGQWWFQPADRGQEHPGRLRAAIDLGLWMLLRFDADDPATGLQRVWLACEQAAAPQAAALRAAVYSRRLNTDPALHRREGDTA
jgi:hypothetical protein